MIGLKKVGGKRPSKITEQATISMLVDFVINGTSEDIVFLNLNLLKMEQLAHPLHPWDVVI